MCLRINYFIIIFLLILAGCGKSDESSSGIARNKNRNSTEKKLRVKGGSMKITSDAFDEGQQIPVLYTGDGQDISPPLEITGVPEGTASLAIISDDPDAPVGTWVHWIVWNIPPDTISIAAGEVPPGTAGRNSWGHTRYGGPAPPSGTHRYFFKLYALDVKLDLGHGAGKRELEEAMKDHMLEKAEIMGTYTRQ